jgi:hypothetical protein
VILASAARVYAELGRRAEARPLLDEAVGITTLLAASAWSDLAWAAPSLGCPDDVRVALDRFTPGSRWVDVARAVLDGAFDRAADLYATIGSAPNEAFARLAAAERDLSDGRIAEGTLELQRAVAFYRSVGAARYLRRADELLAGAGLEIPA